MVYYVSVSERTPREHLISLFEKINFDNIKKVSEIRSDLGRIGVCSIKPVLREDEPLNCACTGYESGLLGLLERIKLVSKMRESVERQLENIVSNYISRLSALDEKKADGSITFSEYLKNNIANDSSECLRDWDSLKKYLNAGLNGILQHYEEKTRIIEHLTTHFNNYLAYSASGPKPVVENAAAKRKIGFRKLYSRIEKEIVDSGYKSVSIDEFERSFRKIVDRVRNEFDEVDIDE